VIQAEYLEMPGLDLTSRQAQPLWGLDAPTCAAMFDALVTAHFLRRNHRDAYVLRSNRKVTSAVRVLVVDDEPLIRWALQQALTDHGFAVTVAGEGQTALRAVADASEASEALDVVDYRLPDSDGLSLFRTIRGLLPRGQVILMTAFGTPEVMNHALDLGAFRVVTKPFEVSDVAAVIRRAHQTTA
jgi:CheY-like chemotaxis protein